MFGAVNELVVELLADSGEVVVVGVSGRVGSVESLVVWNWPLRSGDHSVLGWSVGPTAVLSVGGEWSHEVRFDGLLESSGNHLLFFFIF